VRPAFVNPRAKSVGQSMDELSRPWVSTMVILLVKTGPFVMNMPFVKTLSCVPLVSRGGAVRLALGNVETWITGGGGGWGCNWKSTLLVWLGIAVRPALIPVKYPGRYARSSYVPEARLLNA